MGTIPRRRGFTLVEMLVVIAIIVVLMAILFPVFSTVRRKARATKCRSNMHMLAMALKQYKTDHEKYPGRPSYDTSDGRYHGGFSTLFPDYIDSTDILICPDDRTAKTLSGAVKDKVYSSYNGLVPNAATDDWTLTEVYYNYNGYDFPAGWAVGAPGTSTGVDNGGLVDAGYKAIITSTGCRWRDAPRLKNRAAPGTTIVSHCVHHRRDARNKAENEGDHVVRLDGTTKLVKRVMMEEDPDGAGAKVAKWLSSVE